MVPYLDHSQVKPAKRNFIRPGTPPEMLRTFGFVETLASTGVPLAQEQI